MRSFLTVRKLGSDCIIGANTLVKAGSVIPDGSLVVGSPGKVIRQLDEQSRAMLLGSAASVMSMKAKLMLNELVEVER